MREEFELDYAIIFSGLVELFSLALALMPQIEKDESARMGDFVILGEAVAQVLGHDAGYFSEILQRMKTDRSSAQIHDSAVGTAVLNYSEENEEPIRSLISETYKKLKNYSDFADEWPDTVKQFAAELRSLESELEQVGIELTFHTRSSRGYEVTIARKSDEPTKKVA